MKKKVTMEEKINNPLEKINDVEYILDVSKYIEENKCKLSDIFGKINFWSQEEKSSSSDVIIADTKINLPKDLKLKYEHYNNSVILKIGIIKNKYDETSVIDIENNHTVERQIYEFLQSFVIKNYSPHIIGYLGHFICDKDTFGSSIYEQIENDLNIEESDVSKFDIIILRKSNGISLHKYITTKVFTQETLFGILFQIIYTLICFKQYQLVHNDLHYGNVLIERLDTPVTIHYKISDKIYALTTTKLVKIFDFDRSYVPGQNVELNYMNLWFEEKSSPIFMYNKYKNKDLFLLLHCVSKVIIEDGDYGKKHYSDYEKFVNEIIKDKDKFNIGINNAIEELDDEQFVYRYKYILLEEDSNKIIYPIEDCLKMIIPYLKNSLKIVDDNTDLVFTIPEKHKITSYKPIKIVENKLSYMIKLPEIKLDQKNRNQLLDDLNYLKKTYYNSFGYNINDKRKELVNAIIEKDPKFFNEGTEFDLLQYILVILMILPTYHSLSELTRNMVINIFAKRMKISPNIINNGLNYIWFLFDGKLPIEMPKI